MNDTRPTAPLATLEEMIGIPVTVRTKAGQLIDGTLTGYDEHLNLTLEAGPATEDDPRLIRGNRVVAITHPPIERDSIADEPGTAPDSDDEHEPPTRAADASDTKPSPALAVLKDQLDPKNLIVDVGPTGETLVVTKLGQTYRIYPDGTVEGNGLHRKHLEQLLSS